MPPPIFEPSGGAPPEQGGIRTLAALGFALGLGLIGAATLIDLEVSPSPRLDHIALVVVATLAAAIVFIACRLVLRLDRTRSQVVKAMSEVASTSAEAKRDLDRFQVAINNMSQGLCMFGPDRRLLISNRRYADLYRIPPERMQPGMSLTEIVKVRYAAGNIPRMGTEGYAVLMAEIVKRGEPAETIVEHENGRVFQLGYVPLADGGWVATHQDITDRRAAEAKIAYMVRHDALTDLPNRVAFREQLEQALKAVEPSDGLAVLCLDLDRFKSINDTLGHHVGDLLLLEVANRLRSCVRDVDNVARLSGDEFAIVQKEAGDTPKGATALARRIVETVGAPCTLDGHHVVVGVSIGIAIAPADGVAPDRLMQNADMALYRAKADGRATYRFFEPEMDRIMQQRRALESELRAGLANDEFTLHYQSIVNAKSGAISGFEALLRWRHPNGSLIAPADFIPVAEETGLIVPLGEWVIRQACMEAASWSKPVKVAVNLSPLQLQSHNIVPVVQAALQSSGLAPGRLELEITEGVLLSDSEATLATLHQLRAVGTSISMDDFGTGYSSLSYLRKFPFDKIKIDRSFIRDLSSGEDSIAIVRAVSALGLSLGMTVTAEGIETPEQLEKVRQEGCTEVQGFLFSPPRPASEIAHILAANLSRPRAVA